MTSIPRDVAAELLASFVAAFPGYVAERLAAEGIDAAPFGDAIEEGRAWLERELSALLEDDPGRQRRSPLEVFRMALAFPTDAVAATGAPPVERDQAAVDALPGDVYDLAPASSQALGERAWKAHVAWGIAKAESVAGVVPAAETGRTVSPTIALLSTNLMDRAAIGDAVAAAGYELAVWRNPAAVADGLSVTPPAMALVDLEHPAADDALRALSAAAVPAVAFGPHVDDFAMARAATLGAAEVLPRSRFFRRLPQLLPRRV